MRVERLEVAAAGLIPAAILVGPTLGRFKAPGLDGELLYGTLASSLDPLSSQSPLGALILAGVSRLTQDPGLALGLVELGAVATASSAAFLHFRPAGRWAGWVGAAAAAAAPPLLRAAWTGDLGGLGLGLCLLALLGGRWGPLWALAAAAWSWPLGLVAAAGQGRRAWIPAILLALTWLSPARPEAWALRSGEPPARTVPATVVASGAVYPLPEPPPPPEPPQGSAAWGALGRLPGGLPALAGLLLAPPPVAVAGLAVEVGLLAGFGPLPLPGTPPRRPASWVSELAPPGLGPGLGGWPAAVAAAGLVGLAAALRRWPRLLPAAGGLVLVAAFRENPRLRLPVSPVLPDPALSALARLEPGPVLVFPEPGAPFFMGRRGLAERAWILGRAGREPMSTAGAGGWIRELAPRARSTVDAAAARTVWEGKAEEGWLLLDRGAVEPAPRAELEGWLAARGGAPVAESETWALFRLPGPPPEALP